MALLRNFCCLYLLEIFLLRELSHAQNSEQRSYKLRMLIPLPTKLETQLNPFQLTHLTVDPVIDLAIKDMEYKYGLTRDIHFVKDTIDTNCSDVTGPFLVSNKLCHGEVNVIIGFACVYVLAPVARLSWQYDPPIPLITTGALVHELNDKNGSYKLLTRMNGSYKPLGKMLLQFLKDMKWKQHVFLTHQNDVKLNIGSSECQFQLSYLKNHEYSYGMSLVRFDENMNENLTAKLVEASLEGNIILLCASPDTVRKMMLAAYDLNMVDSGEYVFINIDVSTGSFDARPWHRQNDSQNEKAEKAYRVVKTISLRRMNTEDYKKFQGKVRDLAHNTYHYKEKTGKDYQMNNFISSFYDAVLLYAIALNETLESGGNIKNGTEITQRMWNRTFQGITGEVSIDSNGDRFSDYSLLDLNPDTKEFEEVAFYSGKKDELEFIKNKSIHWVKGRPPADTPVCGWDRGKCPEKGLQAWAWSLIALLLITIIFTVVSLMLFRHYRLEAELSAMSWRIRWEELSGEERRKDRSKQHVKLNWIVDQEQLNPLLRADSRTSLTKSVISEETIQNDPAQQIFTKTASYKGSIVAIKKLNINKPKLELNRTLLLEFKKMKDITNDHITRFIGACADAPHYCLVTEYCPKGSLQDILENESIQLDKMMVYSLVADIVRGMDFIHGNHELKSHGKLKSSNCVVDSRFVLKITDLGFNSLYAMVEPPEDETEESHAFWKKKLWTAPELLRMEIPPLEGTPKGDVYSFGIVLHEMLYRMGVFYLGDEELEPREIVERVIEHSAHPFRPSLNAETICDAVLEKLVERCWTENPQERPDFPAIRKIIRALNKEYETANIVDNLLKRMEQYANNLEALVDERTADYMEEKSKVENLLHQLLPRSVATSLISGEPVKAEAFDQVTIYFSDIVGFTAISASSTPIQVVNLLNDLYTMFDAILENFDVYKVETIGDAYMVVSGLPERIGDRHASEIAKMSLKLLNGVKTSFKIRHKPDTQLKLRIGLHSGSVVAGVVGSKMPRYCLFGDTVNTASRMESNGLPLKIHVSQTCREILVKDSNFELELRGEVEMKGKGLQTTYWLLNYNEVTTGSAEKQIANGPVPVQ